MPQLRWFDGGSLTVSDWHCPGAALGTGAEESLAMAEVSIGRAGSHAVRARDGETVVEGTQLLCVNAGEVFRPVRRALGLERRTQIAITADVLRALVHGEPAFPARTAPLTARAALAHHALLQHVAAATRDDLAIHALALELAGHACCVRDPDIEVQPTSSLRALRDAIRAVQELLVRRYAEPLTLAALADHVGLSPWHLSRSFRAHAGLGLHQYRTRLRLLAALDRIRDARGAGLARIAFEVGFSSHSHLTRAFRAFFRVPPSRLAEVAAAHGGSARAPRIRVRGARGEPLRR
jgi:AraC-like DNA-binding protein